MIYETDFQKTIENAFLLYGASVAQERAIPDVRDGLKIGLRQGIYAQYTNNLMHKDPFRKALKSVSAATAQSYVHGGASMYETFIRAGKPWVYRYPIEDIQGSCGNPCAPDNHAADRYVEMRAGEPIDYITNGLKKNTIDEWYWNYSDEEQIPSAMPSIGFWNIVNGCTGIAVAMTTSVPQFNIKEVNEALIKIIQNNDVDFDEIYCAPDFAQGATITNATEVKESLRNGEGASIRLRATLEYIPEQNMIKATEMPFGVFTNTIMSQLKELTDNDENYGIDKVIDHTKTESDIRIYLRKGVNAKRMINRLYKDTSLENFFAINMIMLDNGRFPKVFGWRQACDAYITHMRKCKTREFEFELDKAKARYNIVEGLLIAIKNIDKVIKTIESSESATKANEELCVKFGLNEEQAKSILSMRLSSLTKMDSNALKNEEKELLKKIYEIEKILSDCKLLDEELIKILKEVALKFGDKRRTKLINLSDIIEEDIAPEESAVVLMFDNNIFRIIKPDDVEGGKRGRKGVTIKPPKGANLINTIYTTTYGMLSCFSSTGKMYSFSIAGLDFDFDYSLFSAITLQDDNEEIISTIESSEFHKYKYVVFITTNGLIKKSLTSDYKISTNKGTNAISLRDNDSIQAVHLNKDEEDRIMIGSNEGLIVTYPLSDIRPVGKSASGVKAIILNNGYHVVSSTIIYDTVDYAGVLTIASDGYGKVTQFSEYNTTSRNAKGMMGLGLHDNEQLTIIYALPKAQDKINIHADGKIVTLRTDELPIQKRTTVGIKTIKVDNNVNDIKIV